MIVHPDGLPWKLVRYDGGEILMEGTAYCIRHDHGMTWIQPKGTGDELTLVLKPGHCIVTRMNNGQVDSKSN